MHGGGVCVCIYVYVCICICMYVCIYTGCAKKKKDILNIHVKSVGIHIFSQKFGYIEFAIFVVKCPKFTFVAQLFIKWHSSNL